MKDRDERWYYKIIRLLKLESTTPHGRVNLAGTGMLLVGVLLYSASDLLKHLISSAADTIKTIRLGEDVYHPYVTSSVEKAIVPVLIGFGLCLLFLYFQEKRKEEIRKQEKS